MKKKFVLFALITILLTALLANGAAAAGTSVSLSAGQISVGGSVTVTVTFAGDGQPMGAVQAYAYYDPAILQYQSGSNAEGGGGTIRLVAVTNSTNQTSIQCSMTFTGLAAGASGVTVQVESLLAYDFSAVAVNGASATVTVVGGGAQGGGSQGGGSQGGGTQGGGSQGGGTQPPAEEEKPIEVDYDGQTLYLWRAMRGVELPDEYDAVEITYNDEVVVAAKGLGQPTLLLWLTDENREGGAFYIYDEVGGEVYPFRNITTYGMQYTILARPSYKDLPEGWSETEVEIGGRTVPAFVCEDERYEGFYLLFAISADGAKDFYLYDSTQDTVQRFVEPAVREVEVQAPAEETPEDETAVEQETEKLSLWQRIEADKQIMIILIALGALSVGLAIASIATVTVRGASKASQKRRARQNEKLRLRAEKINEKAKHTVMPDGTLLAPDKPKGKPSRHAGQPDGTPQETPSPTAGQDPTPDGTPADAQEPAPPKKD